MKKTTAQLAIDLLKAMQADATKYLEPGNECGVDWFVSRMLWHQDGPQQRAVQKALEAENRCCLHDSDCAVHNMPAGPSGPCDCSLSPVAVVERKEVHGHMCTFINRTPSNRSIPDGTLLYSAPQEPAAPILDLYRRALLNIHGDTWREEMSAAIGNGVVPQETEAPAGWTEARIREVASEAAERVGKNASVAPQLCFPHIYLTLKDAVDPAVQIAQNVIAKAAGSAS